MAVRFNTLALLFGNRVALNPGQGDVRDVASAATSHEQTQSNRICCFQTLDAVFPKDLFSDYLINSLSLGIFAVIFWNKRRSVDKN